MKTETFSPGLEGVVAGQTQVSNVDPARNSLFYRGYDIHDLTAQSTFEEVTYLLLYGELPNKTQLDAFISTLVAERALPQAVVETIKLFPSGGHPMDLLRAALDVLVLHEKDIEADSHEANVKKAVRLLAKFPALVSYAYRYSRQLPILEPLSVGTHAEYTLYMLTGQKPDPFFARVFDVSLIAYAEHGFNASTFCGRVTVSTLSDIHSALISAIGTLKGPLHGGANEEAMKMLLEIGKVDGAETWIRDALVAKRKVMGFGHREYKTGDPRAAILKGYGRQMGEKLGDSKWYEIAEIVERVMLSEKALHPNVDFPTAYIYYMMNLPIELYTPIFAIARVSGWCANFIEQLDNNRLFRPKAEYNGPSGKAYVPLAQR